MSKNVLFWDVIGASLIAVFALAPHCLFSLERAEVQAPPPPRALQLSSPIPYKAVVCQSGALQTPRCRFYTGKKLK